PRYAPECLERKLCPSALAGSLASGAQYSTPDPAASQNLTSLPNHSSTVHVTTPDPAANVVYLVALASLQTGSSVSISGDSVDDTSDSSDQTNSDLENDPPVDPPPAPEPAPAPDDPGPNPDPGEPPVEPDPLPPVGPAVPY